LDAEHFVNKPLIAAAFSLVGFAPAQANLVVNGGFEDSSVGNGTSAMFTSIAGWTGDPSIELQNHIVRAPFAGNNLAELDTNMNSAMSQNIGTVAGQTYEISFEYAPRSGTSASSNGFKFLWDGVMIDNIAEDSSNLADTSWKKFTFNEVATGAQSRIEFSAAGTSGSRGGFLDDVQANAVDPVTAAVPEPRTLALFGAGLVAVAVVKRRRGKAI
jgi:hypothetical protein